MLCRRSVSCISCIGVLPLGKVHDGDDHICVCFTCTASMMPMSRSPKIRGQMRSSPQPQLFSVNVDRHFASASMRKSGHMISTKFVRRTALPSTCFVTGQLVHADSADRDG